MEMIKKIIFRERFTRAAERIPNFVRIRVDAVVMIHAVDHFSAVFGSDVTMETTGIVVIDGIGDAIAKVGLGIGDDQSGDELFEGQLAGTISIQRAESLVGFMRIARAYTHLSSQMMELRLRQGAIPTSSLLKQLVQLRELLVGHVGQLRETLQIERVELGFVGMFVAHLG